MLVTLLFWAEFPVTLNRLTLTVIWLKCYTQTVLLTPMFWSEFPVTHLDSCAAGKLVLALPVFPGFPPLLLSLL